MKILGLEIPWPKQAARNGEGLSATAILRFSRKGLRNAVIGAIVAAYILDALFFMAWAPSWHLVPVFLLIGVVIRSVAVYGGPVLQVIAPIKDVRREAATIRGLTVAAGLLCLVPAMSFFAGGHANQTQGATISVATTAVSDTNKAARIATLQQQIAEEEKARDEAIRETNETIQAIVNDDVPGISVADNESIAKLRAEIQQYRADSKAVIDGLRASISTIEQEKETQQTEAAVAETHMSPVYAIFAVVASIWGDADVWALTVLFLLALLVEAIAFFGLGALEGLDRRIIDLIQKLELAELQRKATVDADLARQRAEAEAQLVAIELHNAEMQARTDAIRGGEDGETFDLKRQAERDLRIAKARAEADALRRQAEELERPPVSQPEPSRPNGRDGGKAAQQMRDAARAKRDRAIDLDDWRMPGTDPTQRQPS